jgi:serine/threonine protein phosphatase PrpC
MKSLKIGVDIAACTDVGLVRQNNEDNFIITNLNSGEPLGDLFIGEQSQHDLHLLLAVSDGMGGQLAGEVASQMAVTVLCQQLGKISRKVPAYDRLVQAVEEANYQVFRESKKPEFRGMGATLTAALVENDKVYIAEVGDSRAYLVRDGRIKQVTTDQSLMEVLISRGVITAADAERSTNRGVLLQAIGSKDEIQVAVTSLSLNNKDCLLLCSDGLSNKVKAAELLQFITRRNTSQAACQDMIVTARQRGGEDNITAVLAQFTGECLSAKSAGTKITTTLQSLSTFDPDRPKPAKRRTQRMSSLPASSSSKSLIYPSTVGSNAPNRDLKSYPQRDELLAEFERLTYHLDKSAESLKTEMDGLKKLADWLKQGGVLDKILAEIFTKLRNGEAVLEQTRKEIADAKDLMKTEKS